MAKKIDFPSASLKKSEALAGTVSKLGGSCTIELCAKAMGNKMKQGTISGGFNMVISGAIKFGMILRNGDKLSITDTYKDYELAYSDEEKLEVKRRMFLNPPMFSEIIKRFEGKQLPINILDKMLIKEYNVHQYLASRVAKYFVNGALATETMASDGYLHSPSNNLEDDNTLETDSATPDLNGIEKTAEVANVENNYSSTSTISEKIVEDFSTEYVGKLSYDGRDFKFESIINDLDDFTVATEFLKKKIEKIIKNKNDTPDSKSSNVDQ